jgi:ABC-type proline/glycine betaine transport system ATPase subunit
VEVNIHPFTNFSYSTQDTYEPSTFQIFRTQDIEGSITMNGKERNISQFRKLSAYIMQDNQLHANLTVEEAMNVAANLKLSQKVDKNEKFHVVSVSTVHINSYIC